MPLARARTHTLKIPSIIQRYIRKYFLILRIVVLNKAFLLLTSPVALVLIVNGFIRLWFIKAKFHFVTHQRRSDVCWRSSVNLEFGSDHRNLWTVGFFFFTLPRPALGPPSSHPGGRELFLRWQSGRNGKLITHLHPEPRFRTRVYTHSPIFFNTW